MNAYMNIMNEALAEEQEVEVIVEALDADASDKKNFTAFVKGLEKLSQKTGVLLNVVGGVNITGEKFKKVEYSNDATSGDLSVERSEQTTIGIGVDFA